MSEEAQEGKQAYLEKRKPDFAQFPKRPDRSLPSGPVRRIGVRRRSPTLARVGRRAASHRVGAGGAAADVGGGGGAGAGGHGGGGRRMPTA